MTPKSSLAMLDHMADKEALQRPLIPLYAPDLTPREREVLAFIAKGYTNKSISNRLKISPHTVHFHVSNLLFKLGFSTRTEAAVFAVQKGIA